MSDTFRVRLNCVDHYQHAPSQLDAPVFGPQAITSTQRSKLPQVPIIRVFGATETGQKVCMHIHGALPYLYVPYTESTKPYDVETYISNFRHAVDHALALSYRRNTYENPRNATFVAHVSLVKGVPFFGYNVGYKYFLKVYLLNPLHMTRFADLLQQGAILSRHFQPYEAHLQYLLQWMCDFNLYGCAYIEARNPRFRGPVPAWVDLEDPAHLWHDRSISLDMQLEGDDFPRQSHCQLELDIRVEDILNRDSIEARPLHHSFIERLESLENLLPEEKLVHSMAGLWKDETRRRKLRMGIKDPSSTPFPPEVLVSMSADPRNTSDGGWIHEVEFRQEVAELAAQERRARGDGDISFEDFGQQADVDADVPTLLESVTQLFHSTIAKRAKTKATGDMSTQGFDEYIAEQEQYSASRTHAEDGRLTPVADIPPAQAPEDDDYISDEEMAKAAALTQREKDRKTSNGPKFKDSASVQQQANGLKRGLSSGYQGSFKKSKMEVGSQIRYGRPATTRLAPLRFESPPPSAQPAKLDLYAGSDFEPPPGAQQPSSQASLSLSQSNKLSFPIVKDPQDPGTVFRLSQRDDAPSCSQKQSQASSKTLQNESFDLPAHTESLASPITPVRKWPSIDPVLAKNVGWMYPPRTYAKTYVLRAAAPSFAEVEQTLSPKVIYQDAYYSNEKDVPERPREYAGQEFRLQSKTLPYLNDFDATGAYSTSGPKAARITDNWTMRRKGRECSLLEWEIMAPSPTFDEVQRWLDEEQVSAADDRDPLDVDGPPQGSQLKRKNKPDRLLSQIEGPTQRNKHGFRFSQKKASTSVQHETGYMSTMSLEVHVNSRDDLAPDPERDEINLIIWCLADEQRNAAKQLGIIFVASDADPDRLQRMRRIVGSEVELEPEDTELELLNRMIDIVRAYDPDILTGYEVHNNSWGYLIERARLKYEFNLPDEFSRMKSQSHGRFGKDADRWGFTHTSTVRITGRHTINIWRAMRSELNLLQYTMENVVFHLLHRRIPHYSYATLTKWYESKYTKHLAKLLDHLITRARLDLEILDANELIPRTSEQARLLGVDFFSVFSRGSQFKVESLMFRIAKPESFVLVSPSRKQVGAQNALECLPLVMEPQSAFYSSPLLVLDFQSLYPSVMIAYNYCYSTCLGRITNWRGTNKLGFADFRRTPGLLELVQDKLNIAPNGMMYVRPEMRKSLLAKMLGEILETRVMVKSGMKVDKDDKTLQQLLNNRQLALKLIANVTYGYTSASFSGRMPCSEIADSIVQTGRETLEKAIALIHSVERWGAEVVYGDTDSLFIHLKGRTRTEAFKIGDEIAKAVTDVNPRPIKLKFEKVYHPCVLLAKKRYVGFKYESPDQVEPEFDAKGIETVRRDGTPAEQKIEEKALKLLFRTADLSQVKKYFQAQCTKIMTGRVSIQDFCFAKEVKLGTYADKGPPPPGALIATRRMLRDPRAEPQYGERIPYVVIAGAPGARLWERCVEPERLLHDEHAELDAEYYISKNLIPPLERIFNLVGANVRGWYDEMPKVQRIRMLGGPRAGGGFFGANGGKNVRKTMESYMGSSLCLVCRAKLKPARFGAQASTLPLCHACRGVRAPATILALRQRLRTAEAKARDIEDVCRSCADVSGDEQVACDSRDCPVFYSRVKARTQLGVTQNSVGDVLSSLEEELAGKTKFEW